MNENKNKNIEQKKPATTPKKSTKKDYYDTRRETSVKPAKPK